jgi:hypothetical protein
MRSDDCSEAIMGRTTESIGAPTGVSVLICTKGYPRRNSKAELKAGCTRRSIGTLEATPAYSNTVTTIWTLANHIESMLEVASVFPLGFDFDENML